MNKRNRTLSSFIMHIMILLLILPLLVLVAWSFSKSWPWPNLFPREFGLRGILHVLDPSSRALKSLLLSIRLSLVVTIVTLIISIPAAKALGVYNFKGKQFIKMLVLAPIIVPPVAVGMGIHLTFIRLGLANRFTGVVLVHLIPCLPYGIRILTDVFEIIGESMEQQARVLGANSIQTFTNITLPLIAPGLISAGSLVFIVSFSQYFLTFLIGGGRIITFPMMMFPYIQSGDRMMASAYSMVFILATLVVLIMMEKAIKSYYSAKNYFYL
ncbi:binding-protein-dependent transport systems inner membrane component [Alkaliphilus metalliredigens QYMF]|uniref:Binding-protein-dependent transport systems inner membrane component n=1 Tax=Alkaliphilus metalliredigens (strain QYMF) TaxID=293826 RepID=A6TTA6_ALKMQ|nr:ABC transporter permease subunit [Alkaliphilus metalliredigens]ABR49424.1 binding-protein-dependent transport systems inner membrane component [Alkaliphilus metalliredigens QYMF]